MLEFSEVVNRFQARKMYVLDFGHGELDCLLRDGCGDAGEEEEGGFDCVVRLDGFMAVGGVGAWGPVVPG